MITKFAPITEGTALTEWAYRKICGSAYRLHEAVADHCDTVDATFTRFSRSAIMAQKDGEECHVGSLFRVTCPHCGKRFVDIAHGDPTDSFAICQHCGEMAIYE